MATLVPMANLAFSQRLSAAARNRLSVSKQNQDGLFRFGTQDKCGDACPFRR